MQNKTYYVNFNTKQITKTETIDIMESELLYIKELITDPISRAFGLECLRDYNLEYNQPILKVVK